MVDQLQIDPQATHIMLHCYGGYTTNLALEDFVRPENFFAHTLYGEPLPADHGGPMRVVVPPSLCLEKRQVDQRIRISARTRIGLLGAQWLSSSG